MISASINTGVLHEVANVEVDVVEAVEEGAGSKRRRRRPNTENQQLLAEECSRTVSGGWRW